MKFSQEETILDKIASSCQREMVHKGKAINLIIVLS